MPPQYEAQHPIYSFSGLNIASNPELIPDNALQVCHNFMLGGSGELIKRPTRQTWGSAIPGGVGDAVHIGQANGFDSNAVFMFSGTKTYKTTNDFASWQEITTFAGKGVYDSVQYLSKMYFAAQDGIYEFTSGTTANLISGSPAGCIAIILFQNRLFAITSSRVYYSDPDNPLTGWASYISVAEGDGNTLTAIVAIGDRILLFKQTSIWVLYPNDAPTNWVVRGVSPERGCVSPKAVVNVRGIVYFLDIDGLWITDGVALSRLSDPILPIFVGTGRLRASAYWDTISVYKDYLILKVNCTTAWDANNFMTIFYSFAGAVKGFTTASELLPNSAVTTTGSGWNTVELIKPVNSNQSPSYYAVGPKAYYKLVETMKDQINQPDNIKCFFRTKAMTFDQPTRYKRIKYADLALFAEVNSTAFSGQLGYNNLYYYFVTDNYQSEVEQIWQEGIAGTHNFKIKGPGYGRTHSFYFEETSPAANLQVLGVNFIHQLARQQDVGMK